MKKNLLILTCHLILIAPVSAQTDVYNTGSLYIASSTDTVYITGSLNNTSTASLNNAGGNLYILKNLDNNELNMQSGGGKLWFTGSALQNITGSQAFRTKNWIVNNATGVSLQNRIGVGDGTAGVLDFVNGIISSGTQVQDVYFYPASGYTGYSDSKHIIGYCSKSGSTDFTYPIGNGTLKADLDIANLSSSTDFQCKYFGTGYGIYTSQSPLISVFDKEYWTLDRTSGSSSAQITLKWNDARKPLNHLIPADLRVGHFIGSDWMNEGGSGSGNTATGSVTSVFVNSYSPFTFASTGTTLPLKISDYSVSVSANCDVSISWKAEDETEVAKYIIQKSINGRVWQDAASININTIVNTSKTHFYFDNNAVNGNWVYRIKIENKNGSFFYTKSNLVKLNCNAGNSLVYPTITNQNVNISIPDYLAVKSIIIYNSNGQTVKKINMPAAQLTTVNLSGYPAGKYNIVITKINNIQNIKIIKVN